MADYMNYLNHITKEMWEDIAEQHNLYSIIVFGSIVTEDFHEESDIDFAVIGQDILTLDEKLQIELWLEKQLNRQIDVIDLKDPNLDIFVKIQALNNGISIYTSNQDVALKLCIEETEFFYRINESFYARRRRELLS
ncbi:nucleotidyltransferase family protein [Anaeromicropila herbilytica]|uniref:Polymerase beta nucleotidyltransferase domain-containing protein n=1 Tax=Anaeromicropila herbilytica TaxID=2785025 RepID=A0A7R7ENH4_9FIRM|nr:nucleotidyltransferase domain-containing protein [Anaeromicropila herbilytica]BCN31831.1 hypothetical protein bsdtb5_31260 [Anaeromicropila herbilytica]